VTIARKPFDSTQGLEHVETAGLLRDHLTETIISFIGFAPDIPHRKSGFSRTAKHKPVPNGASHLPSSMEDKVRQAAALTNHARFL
jgi:hypothetical protein